MEENTPFRMATTTTKYLGIYMRNVKNLREENDETTRKNKNVLKFILKCQQFDQTYNTNKLDFWGSFACSIYTLLYLLIMSIILLNEFKFDLLLM